MYDNGARKVLTTQLRLKGGVDDLTLSGALTLTDKHGNFIQIDPGGANRTVTLPEEPDSEGLFFAIYNSADAAENLTIQDDTPTTVVVLNQGESCWLACDGAAWILMAHSSVDLASIKTDVVSESTAAAGVTIDSLLVKDGNIVADWLVAAAIAVANSGTNDAALTVDLTRLDGTVLQSARQVMIRCGGTQYKPNDPDEPALASVTFGTATKGSIIASGAGWCLAETDADGEFDCTVTNTDNETTYFWVESAPAVSSGSKFCNVIASNSDAAIWS